MVHQTKFSITANGPKYLETKVVKQTKKEFCYHRTKLYSPFFYLKNG